ncbi:hypothetical protein C8R43DRAFT_965185 [Mycena crocata]|nr:hypothetical protein C8R43DRAFT_965185 [Mycena crocata]
MVCALWSGRLTQDCFSKPPRNQAAPYLSSRTGPMDRALLVQLPGGLGLNRVIWARRLAAWSIMGRAGLITNSNTQAHKKPAVNWLPAPNDYSIAVALPAFENIPPTIPPTLLMMKEGHYEQYYPHMDVPQHGGHFAHQLFSK